MEIKDDRFNWQKILMDHSCRRSAAHNRFLQTRKNALLDLEKIFYLQVANRQHSSNMAPVSGQTSIPVSSGHSYTERLVLEQPLFDKFHLEQFSRGPVEGCFGEDYRVFRNKRVARIPNGDFLLMSRVMEIEGKPFEINPPASIQVEYDVLTDAWYLLDNDYPSIPYSILMEIALQPCGFLTAYLRTPLLYPEIEYYFRNLDGTSCLILEKDLRGKVIQANASLLSSVVSAGIIIQKFSFELSSEGSPFFQGETTFGFFTGETMAKQAGLDGGGKSTPRQMSDKQDVLLDLNSLRTMAEAPDKPAYYTLPRRQMKYLDEIKILTDTVDGKSVRLIGSKMINPQDWFFDCHFYQDPVMPGSLGVEAVFEALKAYALHFRLGDHFTNPHFSLEAGQDVTWKYRGQIIPANKHMEIEVISLTVEEHPDRIVVKGDASLWVDQVRIYEIKNAAINVREGGKNE